MGKYYQTTNDGKGGKRIVAGSGSDTPDKPSQRYREDTPSFESTAGGNAGRGTQGMKEFSVGNQEYGRNSVPNKNGSESSGRPTMSKKW